MQPEALLNTSGQVDVLCPGLYNIKNTPLFARHTFFQHITRYCFNSVMFVRLPFRCMLTHHLYNAV